MSGTGAEDRKRLRPFPAIDPEPPPRSRSRRVAVAAGAAAAAAVLVAAGLLVAGGRPSAGRATVPIPAVARSGSVLAIDPGGVAVSTDSTGASPRPVPGLGSFPQVGLPGLSPDGRYVTFRDGAMLSLAGGVPRRVADRLSLGTDQILAGGDALSDDDRAAVVLEEGRFGAPTSAAGLTVTTLATGATTPLGTGDSAAGDPQQPGAFVTVAAPPVPTAAVLISGYADARLELRDVGHPSVVLATSAQLNRDLGQDPNSPVALSPVPDPHGDLVAVGVSSLIQGGPPSEGLVFLSRSGQMTATVSAGLGPETGSEPAWSPDGSQLAWVSIGPAGPALTVYSLGGATLTRPVPFTGFAPRCLWSPSGAAVLCDIETSRPRPSATWTVAAAGGGPMATLPAPGVPVAWYRSGSGS